MLMRAMPGRAAPIFGARYGDDRRHIIITSLQQQARPPRAEAARAGRSLAGRMPNFGAAGFSPAAP